MTGRARGLAAGALLGAVACGPTPLGGPDAADPHDRPFTRIAGDPPADVATDRLCDPVDTTVDDLDPLDLDCRLETYRHAPDDAGGPEGPVRVMAFNLERGLRLDALLDAFTTGDLPVPDVLLASELDRGCARTGHRDVTRELAEALGMDGVFMVEFVELPRGADRDTGTPCEHGNAVLSRWPLGNATGRFHEANLSWYLPPEDRDGGEPRLGGRSLVAADVQLGPRLLRAVSVHFESEPASWESIHEAQAAEAAALGSAPGGPAVVGGDTNFPAYSFDLARDDGTVNDPGATALLEAGYRDLHEALDPADRGTRSGLVIDLVFGLDVSGTDPAVCPRSVCDPLSDHQAVWVDVTLDR